MRSLVSLCSVLAVTTALAQTPQPAAEPQSRVRFSGVVGRPATTAPVAPAETPKGARRVEIRQWSVPEKQRLGELKAAAAPAKSPRALTIYHLRAGEVTTVIEGKRIVRHEGEYWTLQPGQTQVLETGNDTAVVETIVVDDG